MATCDTCKRSYTDDVKICPEDGTFLIPSQPKADPFLGKVIDNKYRVIEKIGDGGMGSVYKAEHHLMNRIVALKVLRRSLASDSENDEFLRRFQAEARTASKINHPNAVTIHDFGIEGDAPYLVMEFISGQSLKKIIETEKSLTPARILEIMSQVCSAIDEAHALGIVHRDLKPDNIMISRKRDGSDMAMVLDFGIAKILGGGEQSDSVRTKTGTMIGTPKYMSPEQVMSTPIDNRSDIYSLGIILYEMLVGEVPFDSDSAMSLMMQHLSAQPPSIREQKPQLGFSEQLDSVVLRALKKDPGERFDTVTDFLGALSRAISSPGTVERPQTRGATQKLGNNSSVTSGFTKWVIGAGALATIGIVAVFSLTRSQPQPEKSTQIAVSQTSLAAAVEAATSSSKADIAQAPSPEKLLEEGISHIEKGNFDQAEVALKRVIQIDPGNIAAFRKMAALYTKLGRDEEALGYWEEATHRDASDARSFAVLGLTYKKLGKLFEARVALNKAATIDPTLVMAHDNLAEVDRLIAEESLKRARLSVPIASLIDQLQSEDKATRAEAADLLLERGEEAIPSLQQELTHTNPNVRYWAADVLGRLKATETVPALIALLGDRSRMVQESAVRALQEIGTPEAAAALASRAERIERQQKQKQRSSETESKGGLPSGLGRLFDRVF